MNKKIKDIILIGLQATGTFIISIMLFFKLVLQRSVPNFYMGIMLAFMIGLVIAVLVVLVITIIDWRKK